MKVNWQEPQDVLWHLGHLRWMIVRSLLALLLATSLGLVYARPVTLFLSQPVGGNLVVLGITEAFFVQLKVGFMIGCVVAGPYVFWQGWSFLAPGLTDRERRELRVLVPSAYLLFLLGAAFAYWAVVPQAIRFLRAMAGEQWQLLLSLGQYLSFVMGVVVPFGLAFEAPLLIYIAASLGWVNSRSLRKHWRQTILGIFFASAFLTPGPDPIMQLLMAIPMVALFQLSLGMARWVERRRTKAEMMSKEA